MDEEFYSHSSGDECRHELGVSMLNRQTDCSTAQQQSKARYANAKQINRKLEHTQNLGSSTALCY